jgi:hypothetical protein
MTMEYDQIDSDVIQYTLDYRGPGDLYVNLEKTGEHTYTGTTAGGISLFSGMMTYVTPGGRTVYVPPTIYYKAALPALDQFAEEDSTIRNRGSLAGKDG